MTNPLLVRALGQQSGVSVPDDEVTASLDIFPLEHTPDMRKRMLAENLGGQTADAYTMYLREVGHEPLLTEAQELLLALRISQGDQEAFRSLVEANLRLVLRVAKRYLGRGIGLDDLVQEGNLGLMHAARKYDRTCGTRFGTYAFWWIHQCVVRAIECKATPIRVPSYAHRELQKIRRTRRHFLQNLGREPQSRELVQATGITVERIEELLRAVTPPLSLDKPAYGEEQSQSLCDLIPDEADAVEDVVQGVSFGEEFRKIFSLVLTEREQKVIQFRHGLFGKHVSTLEEMARQMNVSSERVRQIETGGIEKLRHSPLLRRLSRSL